jgi:hypothetical protein
LAVVVALAVPVAVVVPPALPVESPAVAAGA